MSTYSGWVQTFLSGREEGAAGIDQPIDQPLQDRQPEEDWVMISDQWCLSGWQSLSEDTLMHIVSFLADWVPVAALACTSKTLSTAMSPQGCTEPVWQKLFQRHFTVFTFDGGVMDLPGDPIALWQIKWRPQGSLCWSWRSRYQAAQAEMRGIHETMAHALVAQRKADAMNIVTGTTEVAVSTAAGVSAAVSTLVLGIAAVPISAIMLPVAMVSVAVGPQLHWPGSNPVARSLRMVVGEDDWDADAAGAVLVMYGFLPIVSVFLGGVGGSVAVFYGVGGVTSVLDNWCRDNISNEILQSCTSSAVCVGGVIVTLPLALGATVAGATLGGVTGLVFAPFVHDQLDYDEFHYLPRW